jgi:hypothetical protein
MTEEPTRTALSDVLQRLAEEEGERISIGDLLRELGDRALGALLFVFAFPNVLPAPPGTSAILGLPLVFLAAQLAFRLPPWLPGFIARRSMPRQSFRSLVRRMRPWLQRAERLLRPRASVLALPPMEYAVGLLCLLLAVVVLLPIPAGDVRQAGHRLRAAGLDRPDDIGGAGSTITSATVTTSHRQRQASACAP